MPHIGMTELLLVLGVIVLIFGVGKLPELGAGLGKSIQGFRHAVAEEPVSTPEAQGPSGDEGLT